MKKHLICVLIFISVSAALFPQENEPVILSKGPVIHEGIEYLGINAISSRYGEYTYTGDMIPLYYTLKDIFFSDRWEDYSCGDKIIRRLKDDGDRLILAYTDPGGWTAFLSFKADADYACEFIDSYSNRQNYFLNISKDETQFSFPAVLELR